jgi:hypothetical protein
MSISATFSVTNEILKIIILCILNDKLFNVNAFFEGLIKFKHFK